MIPVVIDPERAPLALIGRGDPVRRRLALLLEGGAEKLSVYSDAPCASLIACAGKRLARYLPEPEALDGFALVWIAGLPGRRALDLARAIRTRGPLVNVEDARTGCDFHNPAQLRRGDLLIGVSTHGRSPGLAARVKRHLERSFGPEWADRVRRLGDKRSAWRGRARTVAELRRLTDAALDSQGWLDERRRSRRWRG